MLVGLTFMMILSVMKSSNVNCPCTFPVNDDSEKARVDAFLSTDTYLRVCMLPSTFQHFVDLGDASIWSDHQIQLTKIPAFSKADLLSSNCQSFWNVTKYNHKRFGMTQSSVQQNLQHAELCPQSCSEGVAVLSLSLGQVTGLQKCEGSLSSSSCLSMSPQLQTLSCTMDFASGLWDTWKIRNKEGKSSLLLPFVLSQLSRRRWMECSEYLVSQTIARKHSLSSRETSFVSSNDPTSLSTFTSLINHRRQVFLVIVWIGTSAKIHIIYEQMRMLLQLHPDLLRGNGGVEPIIIIPWAATDEVYSCRQLSTKCLASNRRYGGLLTQSAVNFMPIGWGCAQRRPLRSISHVLALLDPTYLVLLDDDSAFNLPRFIEVLVPHLQNYVVGYKEEPVIIGEMLGRTGNKGHLSKLSLFVGGSGYILNAPLLKILHQFKMPLHHGKALKGRLHRFANDLMNNLTTNAVTVEDKLSSRELLVGSDEHWRLLSVLGEGLEAIENVNGNNTRLCEQCVQYDLSRERNQKAQNEVELKPHVSLGVRLIDYCANLMANEHTCQHSDHSLGRCLLYAAQALPINAVCIDRNQYPQLQLPQALPFWSKGVYETHGMVDGVSGMCFTAPFCDAQQHLTCHRYLYNGTNDMWSASQLFPNTNSKHGYYRRFTSERVGSVLNT